MSDFSLRIELDPSTGQLLELHDPTLDMPILRFRQGAEIEFNGVAPDAAVSEVFEDHGRHVTTFDLTQHKSYKAGQRFAAKRFITLGGVSHATGPSQSLHMRYEFKRVPWGDWEHATPEIWGPPLEAPFVLETLGLLGAPTDWFGPNTRMRVYALGGCGPREHVSYEDGPVREVLPYVQSDFRQAFPGQITIPGAMYYDPETERYVWIVMRRPHTGGTIEHGVDHQRFRVTYYQQLKVQDQTFSPEVSVFWGRGLDEADRVLAEQFDLFEEPPSWWFHTVWFWLHPMFQANGSLEASARAVDILSRECGVNGFGLGAHDVPWSGRDIDPRSLGPMRIRGGDDRMKRLCDRIHEADGHSYVWITRTGLFPYPDLRESWKVKGEDGRALEAASDQFVNVQMFQNGDSGVRDYLFEVIDHYVNEIGVDGVFWDSGIQPMPPDFAPHDGLDFPGQAMTAPYRFYEQMYRYGKSLTPDFFTWIEGTSTEVMTNALSCHQAGEQGEPIQRLMQRIAHAGPRRLVWRTPYDLDVSGAFPRLRPGDDVGKPPTDEPYHEIAADPMNQWLCRFVRERGCRDAVGVGPGAAVLDDTLVLGHKAPTTVDVPQALARSGKLASHLEGGGEVAGDRQPDGAVRFELPGAGAWRFA